MKNASSLRRLLLCSFLALAATAAVRASDLDAQITHQLSTRGEVTVQDAGPYVQVGSYRIWVSSHLGKPATILADGTWLYRGYQVDDSAVRGTLAVSFHNGQVASLKLLSGERVAALIAPKAQGSLYASR